MSNRHATTLQFEGTWEDLVRHADQFAGKRLRVTVIEDEQARLRAVARKLMEQVDKLEPDPTPLKLEGDSAEFAEALARKYREQGLDV